MTGFHTFREDLSFEGKLDQFAVSSGLASMSWHDAGQHVLARTPGWPACLGTNRRLASMFWHGHQAGQHGLARTPGWRAGFGWPLCLGTSTRLASMSWHEHQAGQHVGTNEHQAGQRVLAHTNTRLASMS